MRALKSNIEKNEERLNQDRQAQDFLKFYRNQAGGKLPVFHAANQYGDGIGDFFRGILRHVAPFVMPLISSVVPAFFGAANKGIDEGKTTKEAYKDAIRPGISAALTAVNDTLNKQQHGNGRRRRSISRKPKSGTKKRVYKRRASSRKTNLKSIKIIKTNF